LNSQGGRIADAINIGHMIRDRRFRTVVGTACVSSCALIWLAGVERGAFDDSNIGFHSAYNIVEGNKAEVSGGGNAVVGAYLAKLGFSYDTIYYFTKTTPESAEWFTFAKAKELGIRVTKLSGAKYASTETTMTPAPKVTAPQRPTSSLATGPKSTSEE
jgi:hypothetical protein